MMPSSNSSPSTPEQQPPNPDEQLPLLAFWHGHDHKCHWEGRLIFDNPDEIMADVTLSITVFKRSTGIEAVGSLSGSARVACQQCTGEVWTPLEADVQERFVLSSLAPKANRHDAQQELSDDDFYEVIDIRLPLDLRELARQLVLLHAPNYAPCNVSPIKKCKNYIADREAEAELAQKNKPATPTPGEADSDADEEA
jgi:uncharacterized metal-binding protein YceD (DUF177 family)